MDVIDTVSEFLDELEDVGNPKFRYPQSHQSEYKGTVKFTALKADYQTIGSSIIGNANVSGSTNAFNNLLNELNEFLDFFNDLEALLGGNFRTLEYNGIQHDPVGSVTMHLPTSLSFRDNIDYQNIAFGATGTAAERVFRQNPNDGWSCCCRCGANL
jgi:hypothetical protein